MKQWVRRKMDELCARLGTSFTPDFGVPVTLQFSDAPEEGTSEELSRADHRHGMPAEPDSVIDAASKETFDYIEFMMKSSSENTKAKQFGGNLYGDAGVTGVGDNPGTSGSFGHAQLDMGVGVAGDFAGRGIQVTSSTTLDPTTSVHTLTRLNRLITRIRSVTTAGAPTDIRIVFGAFTIPGTTSADDISAVTDGIYFYIDNYTVSTNQIMARCTAASVTTSVDTGVVMASDVYQTFLIDFTTQVAALFYIDGELVATIDTNLPTNRIAGYMVVAQKRIAAPNAHKVVIDGIVFQGKR